MKIYILENGWKSVLLEDIGGKLLRRLQEAFETLKTPKPQHVVVAGGQAYPGRTLAQSA